MHANEIKNLIEQGIPDTTAHIKGNDGKHYSAIVISPAFEGKNRIQKQQLVHHSLGTHITHGTIHAITIKTFTPQEWHEHNENKGAQDHHG